MLTIGRGQHGSTYGGNPVAARVALAALQVIVDEGLVENSYKLGQLLRHELQTIQSRIVTEVSAPAYGSIPAPLARRDSAQGLRSLSGGCRSADAGKYI